MSGEDKSNKPSADYSAEVAATLPKLLEPAQKDPKQLKSALENLLALEKKTRLASDARSTTQVAVALVQLCYDCKDWTAMCEQIKQICDKRAQLQKVITTVIQESMKYLDLAPSKEALLELIKTLRQTSEGRIFVELERARLTRRLSQIREKEGNVAEASDLLNDVQVETIGTMEIREKSDYLLEQLRLCLAKKDYIRSEIIAKKINPKTLAKDELQDLKIKHYELMIQFYLQRSSWLDICRAYLEMFNTKSLQEDPNKWKPILKRAVMFAILSPFDSEIADITHRLKEEKKLTQLPNAKTVVDQFVSNELMAWPLAHPEEWNTDPFFRDEKEGKDRWTEFHKRVVQHNIRVIALYYGRITMARLSALIQLDETTSEKYLSELVSSKQLYAKYDRRTGIVSFAKRQDSNELVQSWANDISKLLTVVEDTCHLINRENMMHGVKGGKEEEEEES